MGPPPPPAALGRSPAANPRFTAPRRGLSPGSSGVRSHLLRTSARPVRSWQMAPSLLNHHHVPPPPASHPRPVPPGQTLRARPPSASPGSSSVSSVFLFILCEQHGHDST